MEESIETNPEPASPTADRLSEVLRLTATLSDRVLDAQIMKRPVPDEQVRALAGAARLLREHDVEWPPMLGQVLNAAIDDADENEPPPTDEAPCGDDLKATGLNRFLRTFRKSKDGAA